MTLEAALRALEIAGVRVVQRSRWYHSAPVPVSDQPWFVNGVARLETAYKPLELLGVLQQVESRFGRVRERRWEARAIDLDIIAFDGVVMGHPAEDSAQDKLIIPHPRLAERLFVLRPLAEIAPDWRHPITGKTAEEMIKSSCIRAEVAPMET
jgi:2-amino-4-hydroxy-6-hydroxymethyldihydropteridine diphosphokinase